MKSLNPTVDKLWDRFARVPDIFLDPHVRDTHRGLFIIWVTALYIFGILFWGNFLNWTKTPLDFEDWGVINLPRLDFMSDALRNGHWPLHMDYPKFDGQDHPLHRITDRYLTMPDVITTPQTLLLKWIGINVFVYLDLIIQFTIGTLGLLWFQRKYNLSMLAYGFLFLLFGMNGYIQAHYAVGHITWAGYFLFPWVMALLIGFFERQGNWHWVAAFSLLLFYMVLAGSQHHFTWVLIFLAFCGLVQVNGIRWVIGAGLFAGLLSAIRLLPPVLVLSNFYDTHINKLLVGYPTALDLLRSLVVLVEPGNRNFVETGIPWLSHWEFDVYVGLAGALFVGYFGVYGWIRSLKERQVLSRFILPTLAIVTLTVGHFYEWIRALHIPLLDGERVPSRMIGLPLAVIIILATVFFQGWIDRQHQRRSVIFFLGVFLFLIIGNDLWAHSLLWNLNSVRETFGPVQISLAGSSVVNHADQPYFAVLIGGLGLSTLAGIFLLYQIWREIKSNTGASR